MMQAVRDLKRTAKFGMLYGLDISKGTEVIVDNDFSRGCASESMTFPKYVLSRTGHVKILFLCPLFWHASKLKSEIVLNTTESECIAMSQALRSVVPLINLMNEFILALNVECIKRIMKHKVYEDS